MPIICCDVTDDNDDNCDDIHNKIICINTSTCSTTDPDIQIANEVNYTGYCINNLVPMKWVDNDNQSVLIMKSFSERKRQ